jgi:5-methyltetrahydropteroyltriglutamate--homocysteine methyltransferase
MPVKTTHVGSLPRNQIVADLLFGREKGMPFDEPAYDAIMRDATAAIVAKQRSVGIDLPSDGETSKISYATYIKDRLTGFEGDSPRRPPGDLQDYPGFLEKLAKAGGTPQYRRPRCVGPIKVKNLAPLHTDIAAMKAGMAASGYLFDIADAMSAEYEAIVASGLILQIDAPDLALGRHMLYRDLSEDEFLRRAEVHVEALNHGLRNVPGDRVRLHICWGNYEGPHTRDIALGKVLPVVLKAKPRGLLFEGANPRHAHEWTVWNEIKAPDDYVLIPGCLDSTTNFVEHPELIRQRLERYTSIVGTDRVIAGTDCGFSTFAGFGVVDPDIVWAKMASLVEGARAV